MPTGDYQKYMPKFPERGIILLKNILKLFMLMPKISTFQKKMCGPEFLFRVWMAKPGSGSKSY
jgi:hypothetical protein